MSSLRRFQPLGIRFSGLVLTAWHWEQVQTTGVLTAVVVVDTSNIQRRRSIPVLERSIREQLETEKLSPISLPGIALCLWSFVDRLFGQYLPFVTEPEREEGPTPTSNNVGLLVFGRICCC